MARKHNLDEVLRSLSKKRDCKIFRNRIEVLNGENNKYTLSNDLGNGSWGKISYLCKIHGFWQMYVGEFSKNN